MEIKIDDMMRTQSSKSILPPVQINTEIDIPAQIRKLFLLIDEGILTEEEFNSKKSDLLSKM